MDNSTSRDIDDSRKFEKELIVLLKTGNTSYTVLEGVLGQIRESCSNALFADYEAASAQSAETRLWDSHQKVNSHYRAALAQMKKSTDKKIVEQRKLGTEYLKFIKTSQKFYRDFIGKLSSAYGNIPAIQRVAGKFGPEEQSRLVTNARGSPGHLELEQCCHRTLIRLGDLSRYREMELVVNDEDRDWAPAIGYYDLALTVCPGSGQPFNQRAIIAIANRNLFRATYYAYRSLTAEDPHPQADDNLRRVMHMVSKAWEKGDLASEPTATAGSSLPKKLAALFLRLVEQYSHGTEASVNAELEQDVTSQLKANLERGTQADAPVKFILISIAAQQAAQDQLLSQPQNYKLRTSFIAFLELNMRLFSTFLEAFRDGLLSWSLDNTTLQSTTFERDPSLLLRRVLPVTRLYSSWLTMSSALANSDFVRNELKAVFWTSLARALSAITSTFPTDQLPTLDHLLEEDEETVKFPPLCSSEEDNFWYHGGSLRATWHEKTKQERDANKEALFRIKDFLVVGLTLTVESDPPLKLDQTTSTFTSSYGSGDGPNGRRPRVLARPSPQVATAGKIQVSAPNKPMEEAVSGHFAPPSSQYAEDLEAERMVASLVGLTEDSSPSGPQHVERQKSPEDAARPSMTNTTSITTRHNPAGSNTVADVMARAFKSSSQNSGSATGSGSRVASRLQSPAVAPTLPRQPSHGSDRSSSQVDVQRIWDTPQANEDGRRPCVQALSPSLAARSSPFAIPRSHSRGNSNELSPSIWSPQVANTNGWPRKPEAPSMSRTSSGRNLQNLGNGTSFGTASPTIPDFTQSGTDYGWGTTMAPSPSPNPWNADYRTPKRVSAGSPLTSHSAQLPNGHGKDFSPVSQAPSPRLDAFSAQAKAFRPSKLQHTTAQRMT